MLNKYDGYTVGPNLRQLRKDKKLSVYQVSELTGLSNSSINQIEQGGRGLSMNGLYLLMDAYQCDANKLLNIEETDTKMNKNEDSIDSRLSELPVEQQNQLRHIFEFMIKQATRLISKRRLYYEQKKKERTYY